MPKAGVVKVETSRRACGEAAAWLRADYAAPAPTLLGGGEDSAARAALCCVLTRAAQRVGKPGLTLALGRADALWLATRAPSAAPRVPVLGGLFFVDVGAFAQAPRAVRDLAKQCAVALRVRRGCGHKAFTRDRLREEIEFFAETRGSHAQSVSDQRARAWRRRERREEWVDRLHARGGTLLTSTETPPT